MVGLVREKSSLLLQSQQYLHLTKLHMQYLRVSRSRLVIGSKMLHYNLTNTITDGIKLVKPSVDLSDDVATTSENIAIARKIHFAIYL